MADLDIPIIGETVHQVLQWYPTTLIACRCRGPNYAAILVITGFNNAVQCPHCERLYRAVKLTGEGMEVEAIIPTPHGKVM